MKIFHIVEEVSKKNNSIVSVTQILLNYSNNKNSKLVIPLSKYRNINKVEKIKKIKIFKNCFKYKSEIRNFLTKNQPDLIHIHGLWRPIHIIFIFASKHLNIPIIIQPHGMLLDEALKTKTKINYILKLIIISIYKILLKKAVFIAVTEEEKKSIYKYFKTKNIIVIPNPFKSTFKVQKKVKKNISYFGRFSTHKNIDLIINAFADSKLDKNWKLIIYGIDDDNNYKSRIVNLINKLNLSKKIIIKKPIFERNRKFRTMSENFLNILMSKSEILSLSVLEGLSVGTSSLVNNQIKYPKNISNLLYFAEPNKKSISSQMNKITKKFEQNYNLRKKTRDKFKKIYDLKFSENKYSNLVNKLINKKEKIFDINFINISVANGLNSFLVPFLVVMYGLIDPKISAEIGIIEGTILYFTYVFSSNSRSILLNEKSEQLFLNFISFRLLLSIFLLFIFIIFFSKISFIENDFHNLLILLILLSWINEITLVYIEKYKLKLLMKIFIMFSFFFYSITILSIFNNNIYFKNILTYYLLFHFLFINYFFSLRLIFIPKIKLLFFYENIYPFLSTFSNTTSVLFWRYSILFFTTKEIAGVIFAIFSIASFPGTFYNNILGQTILRQKKINLFFKKYENIFYLSSFILIILNFLILKGIYKPLFSQFAINTLTISLLGTVIMIISLRKRHTSLFMLFEKKDIIFKRDIIYSLCIFPIIIILFNLKGIDGISFGYFISALISYCLYSLNYDDNIK